MNERGGACPKCRGPMQAGFIQDSTYGGILVSTWQEGAPEKNFLGSLKTRGRNRIPVTTYRCESCGYLESYA
jgi:hypothetical protein